MSAQAFPGISDFSDEVTIEAGRTVTATIRLERVMDVDGVVVDAAGALHYSSGLLSGSTPTVDMARQ